MLSLSGKVGEKVIMGEPGGELIEVTVLGIRGNTVRLGFDAPKDIPVNREKIFRRMEAEANAECGMRNAECEGAA